MKIIVTGGAGFIASHIVDAYIAAGHKVAVIDNLSSGSRKNLNPRANFYKADIRNLAALHKIFGNERPDVVNHHAAFISVTDSVKKPDLTFAINAEGTLNVLLAFADAPAKRKKFIFASTGGAIYGSPKKLPAGESTPPDPLSPYALTKQVAEETVWYFSRQFGIDHLILRYANVYGPRQKAQGGAGVFPIFTEQIAHGIRPTIFGDGKKTRDYVYVGDVARASVLGVTRGRNETVNIATGRETSDYQVFRALADAYGFKKEPFYTPKRKGEVQRIFMSWSHAKKVLGWSPKVKFAEGVRKTTAAGR
ncbi:MAG TPA: NAD-dependent epimerase/dehydratase family protein [Candidatus Paceibacterota bacterium]|nr:NAD-dependent epimerase/dehydratase family protein [Candidatus Paceibacterota bacterium]